MTDIMNFIKYKPVQYTVHLSHDDRGFSVQVMDVSENEQSRKRVAEDLRKAADLIDPTTTDSKSEDANAVTK